SRAGRARHELLRAAVSVDRPGAGHGSVQWALSRARPAERGTEVLRLQRQAHARRLPTERAGAARNPLGSRIRERKNRIFGAAVNPSLENGRAPRKSLFLLASALAVVGS